MMIKIVLLLFIKLTLSSAWIVHQPITSSTLVRTSVQPQPQPHQMMHASQRYSIQRCAASSRRRRRRIPNKSGLCRASADMNSSDGNSEATIALESLYEMDCFIFSRNNNKNSDDDDQPPKLELGVLEESVVQPICAWTTEEAFDDYIEFLVDEEDRYSVSEATKLMDDMTVHSLIPSDSLTFGSRQVGGGMGPTNPHGEHSELLYYIKRAATLDVDGLEVIIKPELEIFW